MRSGTFHINLLIFLILSAFDCLAQQSGCTDSLAKNYNPSATINDGSCVYTESSVYPDATFIISGTIHETSGLILYNNNIWTHNDNDDIKLYSLDTLEGGIVKTVLLTGTTNKDWEEISQDNDFIYIGDFGNNSTGNRRDLKILRIRKSSININDLKIDTINFSYSDQTDFTPAGSNYTDFDCEAFIVASDSIYLFTKQWVSQKTSLYSLPKTPGTYLAKKKSTYNVEGLITGSTYLPSKRLIVLCGYNNLLEPFLYLLYDFNSYDFFSGNKRKISIPLSLHQVEGITTTNGLKYYISNESFTYSTFVTIPQKLHILNLNTFLENYLESISSGINNIIKKDGYIVFPIPAENNIRVKRDDHFSTENYSVIDYTGRVLMTGILFTQEELIDIDPLPPGIYILKIGYKNYYHFKVIKE